MLGYLMPEVNIPESPEIVWFGMCIFLLPLEIDVVPRDVFDNLKPTNKSVKFKSKYNN